ncbi:basic proline-rich protein-like [Artibeus jamaicensis]|uniref:basic proline-rich protein-like n=1 Tax=Artibeus jamaicensis TaxID=9417 RepID=UPI00235ABBBA|nr:basic proline-rich protein-like [Artibeus jamaicensis]
MVSARGISLLLLESRSSYTLSSSPQHCGPGGEAAIPPPSACVKLRGGSRPADWRCSGGRVCPGGFLRSGGRRADSSDAGLVGFAPFSRLSVLIKQLCVRRRHCPLSSASVPSVPAPAPRPPEGVSGSAHRNPAPPKPPPGRRPPRASPARAPPLRPHPTAAAPDSAARKQQRQRRQLRAPPPPGARGRNSDPLPSVLLGAAGTNAPSTGRQRGGSRPHLGCPRTSPPRDGLRTPASAAPRGPRSRAKMRQSSPGTFS